MTERDLFNCHGTFFELPAVNAGGFAKIRPISTHNSKLMTIVVIADYSFFQGSTLMRLGEIVTS